MIEDASDSKARARLVRNGKVYATGPARNLVVRRDLKAGAYRLVVGGEDGRRLRVRIG